MKEENLTSKLKLNNLSEKKLSEREQSRLLGGDTCCICGCGGGSALSGGTSGDLTGEVEEGGGYGSGSFGS